MRRYLSTLLVVLLLFSFINMSCLAGNDAPFEVSANSAFLVPKRVGTANIPELDNELQGIIGYAPGVYLVTVPYGCNEIKIKATDETLIMGETSDSQVLTEMVPDANGYYSISIAITEEKIASESQWKDDGFTFL